MLYRPAGLSRSRRKLLLGFMGRRCHHLSHSCESELKPFNGCHPEREAGSRKHQMLVKNIFLIKMCLKIINDYSYIIIDMSPRGCTGSIWLSCVSETFRKTHSRLFWTETPMHPSKKSVHLFNGFSELFKVPAREYNWPPTGWKIGESKYIDVIRKVYHNIGPLISGSSVTG